MNAGGEIGPVAPFWLTRGGRSRCGPAVLASGAGRAPRAAAAGRASRSAFRLSDRGLTVAVVPADDDADVPGRLLQLAVDVLPLAHAQEMQVLAAAQAAES